MHERSPGFKRWFQLGARVPLHYGARGGVRGCQAEQLVPDLRLRGRAGRRRCANANNHPTRGLESARAWFEKFHHQPYERDTLLFQLEPGVVFESELVLRHHYQGLADYDRHVIT